MSDILVIVSITVGVLFGGGGIVGYLKYRGDKRQKEHREREVDAREHLEKRKELGATLHTHAFKYRNLLIDWRTRHDYLVVRFIRGSTDATLRRRKDEALNALLQIRSRFILEPGGKSLDEALSRFLQACDDYAAAMDKPLYTLTQKANSQKLNQLQQAMIEQCAALEAAIQQFVNAPQSVPSSTLRRRFGFPLAWMRHFRR